MDIDVLNSQLYDKMVASQEKMKDWLQSQSFDDMMRNAREYLVREDIVLSFEFHDLSDEQVFALWEREDPLAELYAAFEKAEDHHMEKVKDTLENRCFCHDLFHKVCQSGRDLIRYRIAKTDGK